MKSTDLILGNVVYDRAQSKPIEINLSVLAWIAAEEAQGEKVYSPVVISPVILEASGFSYYRNGMWYFKGDNLAPMGFEICKQKEGGYAMTVNTDEYTISRPFMFCHELQNLFLAIAGFGLKIKIPELMTLGGTPPMDWDHPEGPF